MNRKRVALVALGLLLMAGAALLGGVAVPEANAQQSSPASSQHPLPAADKRRIQRFAKELEDLRKRLRIPGMSAGIIEGDKLVWAQGFGFSDYENKVRATPDTPYELASVSKPFGATLLMQLVEQGKVSLDDPMSKYSSDYKDDRVKVWHVLTHTSEGVPGEHYSYNGDLFDNLTEVVMKAAGGQRYRLLLARNILDKIGAEHSAPGNDYEGDPAAMTQLLGEQDAKAYFAAVEHLAKSYRLYDSDEIIRTYNPRQGIGTANGMVSSVTDLARFDAALDHHLLLKPETQERMWTPSRLNSGALSPYGLGWFVQTYHGKKIVWHNGYLPELYSALYLKIPDQRLALILLANSDALSSPFYLGKGDVTASAFACRFLKAFITPAERGPAAADDDCVGPSEKRITDWLDARRKSAHHEVKIDPAVLRGLTGLYQFPFGTLTIIVQGDRLARKGRMFTLALYPESATQFFCKATDGEYSFIKNDAGQIVQLKVMEDGEEYTGIRAAPPTEVH